MMHDSNETDAVWHYEGSQMFISQRLDGDNMVTWLYHFVTASENPKHKAGSETETLQ